MTDPVTMSRKAVSQFASKRKPGYEAAIVSFAVAFDERSVTITRADYDRLRISDTATFQTFDEVVPGWSIQSVFVSAAGDRVVIGGEGSLDGPLEEQAKLAVFELDEK